MLRLLLNLLLNPPKEKKQKVDQGYSREFKKMISLNVHSSFKRIEPSDARGEPEPLALNTELTHLLY